MSDGAERHPLRQQAANEGIHTPFLLAALGFAVLGGFTLAVTLPVQAALGDLNVSWLAHAQVHGHLQVVGFAAMFVLGVSSRLAPHFGTRPIASRWLYAAFWLLLAGLLGRAVGQPLADHPAFGVLMVVGAAAEALGALTALGVFVRTLQPWPASTSPSAVLLAASAGWLAVQACLGAWWLLDLARDQQRVLPSNRDAVLLQAQVFGVLLSALIGVGLRSFPTFFGAAQPKARYSWTVVALLQGGLLLWTGGLLRGGEGGRAARLATDTGQLAAGAAVLGLAMAVGWWRRGNRLAPASRHIAWSLRLMLVWLTSTGAVLSLSALRALARDGTVSLLAIDGIRHMFLIGAVTLAITVVGQLILPEFASERLVHPPAKWRGWAFGVVFSAAALLRGVIPLAGVQGEERYWLMSVAGVLGLGSLIVFAYLYLRARRSHRAYLARNTRWRSQEVPLR